MGANENNRSKLRGIKPIWSNKKAYLRIVEAFIAILLISGVLLFVMKSNNQTSKEEVGLRIMKLEGAILQEISGNLTFRNQILNNQISLSLNAFVENRKPKNYDFQLAICGLNVACPLPPGTKYPDPSKEIYSNAMAITTNITSYQPRQLKIFVWEK